MRYLLIVIVIFSTSYVSAQKSVTIRGTITDFQNGEHLVGVAIYDSISKKGTIANDYGFYSLTLPGGNIRLLYSTLGYQSEGLGINITKDTLVCIKRSYCFR
jgi:hypothetical protein